MMLFAFPLSFHHGWMHTAHTHIPSTTLFQLYEKDIQSFSGCNLKPNGDRVHSTVHLQWAKCPLTCSELSVSPVSAWWK